MSHVGQRVMQKLLGMVVPEVRTAVLLLLLMRVMEKEQWGRGMRWKERGGGEKRKATNFPIAHESKYLRLQHFSTGHLE